MNFAPSTAHRALNLDGDADFRMRLSREEPRALEQLFDTYFNFIYGRVQGHVHNHQLAEDLTQDVFLKIQRSLSRYDPSKRLGPWLSAIVRNRVYDHWRSWRSAEEVQSIEQGGAGDVADASSEALLKAAEEGELNDAVRSAVDHLPAGMRSVMHMRVYGGLPFEAIARALNLTTTTARKRYSRGLRALRETLPFAGAYA